MKYKTDIITVIAEQVLTACEVSVLGGGGYSLPMFYDK